MEEVVESPPVQSTKKGRRKIVILVSGIFLLLTVLLVVVFLNVKKTAQDQNSPQKTQIERVGGTTQKAPDVVFNDYTLATSLPTARPRANAYILKNRFTKAEVSSIAQSLGLTEEEPKDNRYFVFYNMEDTKDLGIIQFDSMTGSFTYNSYGEQQLSGSSPQSQAESMLEKIGIGDEFTTCAITYRRIDTPNTTFAECHREWSRLGAPLVNLGGVLNIPEGTGLSSLRVGLVDENSPQDAAVTGVSTGQSGRARPNDFNTATVAIRNGRVISVVSNLRWLEAVEARDLVTPQEALSLFQNKKAEFSLTIPAGEGAFDWAKVYPGNAARSGSAVIQDISLVYLDKPVVEPQDAYHPMYLIRGISQLESGYAVRFAQLVSAHKGAYDTSLLGSRVVAGTSTGALAQNRENLQLETFTPTGTITVTPTVTLVPETTSAPTATVTTTPTPQNDYCAQVKGPTVTLNVPGYGQVTIVSGPGKTSSTYASDGVHTFFLQRSSIPNVDLSAVKQALYSRIEEQYVTNVSRWFKDNISSHPVQAKADVSSAFRKINNTSNECESIPAPYPAPASCAGVGEVRTRVTDRVYDIVKNNEIDKYAGRGNLFPAEVIKNIHYVFMDLNKQGTGETLYGRDMKCYISGNSPVIFAYSPSSLSAGVGIGSPITYADPALNNSTWSFVSSASGVLNVNGSTRDRMYYEYNKESVHLNGSGKGYVVKSEELSSLAAQISESLGLNSSESQALVSELTNARSDLGSTKYLKVELVSASEISQKLPFTISPTPNTLHRIHFVLSKSNRGAKISAPTFHPLGRLGFTVIELGASAR